MPPARIDRGDVFWIGPDDPHGPVPGHPHPHVVVQEDLFNHSRVASVVVCALTSNMRRASWPGNVILEAGEAEDCSSGASWSSRRSARWRRPAWERRSVRCRRREWRRSRKACASSSAPSSGGSGSWPTVSRERPRRASLDHQPGPSEPYSPDLVEGFSRKIELQAQRYPTEHGRITEVCRRPPRRRMCLVCLTWWDRA